MSFNFLAHMFSLTDKHHASDIFHAVKAILLEHFVPTFLGYHHISRNEYRTQHGTHMSSTLFVDEEQGPASRSRNPVAVLLDGTSIKIENSSNFAKARQAYSQKVETQAATFMVVAAPDGYILIVEGPFPGNQQNNDEAIFNWMSKPDSPSEFKGFFQKGDIVVWDLGFRKTVSEAKRRGFEVKMPVLKPRGLRQLDVQDANDPDPFNSTWPYRSKQ
jgi:hypothetical protein